MKTRSAYMGKIQRSYLTKRKNFSSTRRAIVLTAYDVQEMSSYKKILW